MQSGQRGGCREAIFPDIFQFSNFWTFFEMLDHWLVGMVRSMVVVVRVAARNYSLPVGAVEPCGGLAPLHHANTAPDSPVGSKNSETQQVDGPGSGHRFDGDICPTTITKTDFLFSARCSRACKCETLLLLSLLRLGGTRGRSFCRAFLGKKG